MNNQTNEPKGPSRGRKQCPNCQAYVGVRAFNCPHCNTPFTKKSEPKLVEPDSSPKFKAKTQVENTGFEMSYDYYDRSLVPNEKAVSCICTPAGKCPVKLEDFTKEGVKTWADEVAKVCAKRGEYLTREAVEYYSRKFYSYGDKQKQELIKSVIFGS